jgi:hypothetical protein
MKKTILTVAFTCLVVVGAQAQSLIAGWDFQTTTTGGTALNASNAEQPTVLNANFGSGTLYLNGAEGSSSWVSSSTSARELNSFAGTAINAGDGFSTVTTGAAALAFVNSTANGNFAVFRFSMDGFTDLSISLAAQRTTTGFSEQVWEWSLDGLSYNPIGTFIAGTDPGNIRDSFANTGVLSFVGITGLNNAPDAFVRVTFNGASAAAGNNRVDNIQFNAVPEPSTYALLVLAGAGLGAHIIRRRRRR